jgi:hypothetical protein
MEQTEWMTPTEAAEHLRVSRDFIKQRMNPDHPEAIPRSATGDPSRPKGMRYRILRSELDEWMKARR